MHKVGIFGGTFDPIHWGHLLTAETALSQVALEQVIWVPAYSPPHKQTARFDHRFQMVQMAIQDHPAFTISSVAAHSSSPSYAIQTLFDLQALYPNTQWYWILGLDTFQTLPRWYRRQELLAQCIWLVAPRPLGADYAAKCEVICQEVVNQLTAQSFTICWQLLHMPRVGISSSLIRQYCHDSVAKTQGDSRYSIRYLVPDAVRRYIATHCLYSPSSA